MFVPAQLTGRSEYGGVSRRFVANQLKKRVQRVPKAVHDSASNPFSKQTGDAAYSKGGVFFGGTGMVNGRKVVVGKNGTFGVWMRPKRTKKLTDDAMAKKAKRRGNTPIHRAYAAPIVASSPLAWPRSARSAAR